ncbi:MAG: ATP-binding protein [Campylobacterales bacterium]|nr:ATP-binding protein [Campylobacterales bacterium]
MIDKKLLDQLSTEDKKLFLDTLDTLINQTYIVENEYKDLKASYEALHKILSEIIEFLPTAIWVLDEQGKIFLQNSTAKLLGFDFQTFKNNGEVEMDERSYLIKSVKLGGKTIVSATDITEQKRTQRLASMGQMAAHLAHEIRNPVGSVAILASTLHPIVADNIKPVVDEIKKSIWRVERIIKATLLFTKGVAVKKTPFMLGALEEEMRSSIGHYSYSKEIDFQFLLPNVEINGDLELLSMIMQNLLFNAIDAIEDTKDEEGIVRVSFDEDENFYFVKVEDSGIPIADKSIIFDPFKTTKTKGNGLGLSLSMQIAEAHGGKIEITETPKSFVLSISKAI